MAPYKNAAALLICVLATLEALIAVAYALRGEWVRALYWLLLAIVALLFPLL
ncbi:MAG: hypothetical protein WA708_00090 [Acidobacteriaceae bacterium]